MDFSFRSWLEVAVAQEKDNEAIKDFFVRASPIFKRLINNPHDNEAVEDAVNRLGSMLYSSLTHTDPNFGSQFKYSLVRSLQPKWVQWLEKVKQVVAEKGGSTFTDGPWLNFYCGKSSSVRFGKVGAGGGGAGFNMMAKSYFKPELGDLQTDPKEMSNKMIKLINTLPKIWNSCCFTAKRMGVDIAFKLPVDLETLLNHRRTIVVYSGDEKARNQIETVIGNLLRSAGLESDAQRGYDIGRDSFDSIRAKQVAHDIVSYIINTGKTPPKFVFWVREKLQQRGLGSAEDVLNRTRERAAPPTVTQPTPTPATQPHVFNQNKNKMAARVVMPS